MDANLLSWSYLPVAVGLGALHAVEPGHAKTMTAAYLIGIHGRWTDAVLLGLAAATAHSLVVIAIAVTAVLVGRETLAGEATWWLQIGSGLVVMLLGSWLLWRRLRVRRQPRHELGPAGPGEAADHDHDHPDDVAHARFHSEHMPAYVGSGARPAWWQVVAFGAAGGLVPCPASITVMLLALSVGSTASGILLVAGFSLGLALALVAVGLVVVVSMRQLGRSDRLSAWSRHAATISAGVIVASGLAAVILGLFGPAHTPGG